MPSKIKYQDGHNVKIGDWATIPKTSLLHIMRISGKTVTCESYQYDNEDAKPITVELDRKYVSENCHFVRDGVKSSSI